MSERYIVAVEISSSKIIASIGKTAGEGQLDVVAVEEESDVEGVRYGIIQNLEETSVRVARLFSKLENRAGITPRKIKGVFVGLSGRSLRNVATEVSISLPNDTEITDEIISRLRADATHRAIDKTLEVVDAVPRIYHVGKSETHSPKGAIGNFIQATYDLVVCRPEMKRNIIRTIPDKLGVKIEKFIVTPLATAHLILSPEEKRLGCMLVDIGAETTTVSIYKNKCLRYFATLPLGGRNITRDITSLAVLEESAEQIKIASGNAMVDDTPSTLNVNGVRLTDVNNLVVARSEEIVANIMEQIEYAGMKESDLPAGIICIGGGSRLKGMTDLISLQSGLQVRRGQLPPYVHIVDKQATNKNIIQVVSLLYAGATLTTEECLEIKPAEQVPVTGTAPEPEVEQPRQRKNPNSGKRRKFLDGLTSRIGSLFTPPDDDSELME